MKDATKRDQENAAYIAHLFAWELADDRRELLTKAIAGFLAEERFMAEVVRDGVMRALWQHVDCGRNVA